MRVQVAFFFMFLPFLQEACTHPGVPLKLSIGTTYVYKSYSSLSLASCLILYFWYITRSIFSSLSIFGFFFIHIDVCIYIYICIYIHIRILRRSQVSENGLFQLNAYIYQWLCMTIFFSTNRPALKTWLCEYILHLRTSNACKSVCVYTVSP